MATEHFDPSKDLMTEAEMHDFGIQAVAKQLQSEGHQIISIETELKKSPQIVATIGQELAFITVRTAPYPGNGQPPSDWAKDKLLEHASKHNATAYFASVGIANSVGVDAGDERLSSKPVRGSGFYVNYRGLRPLATLEHHTPSARIPVGDAIPDDLDQEAFLKAVENLSADLGLLDDLPVDLANTVANVYYHFWAHHLRLAPMKSGAPGPTGMPNNPEDYSESMIQLMQRGPATIAHYKFAGDFIKNIRNTRVNHPDSPEIYDYMVQLTLDTFKYRIENANKKSPIRRSLERMFKTPKERAGLYARMREIISVSLSPNSNVR